VSIERVYVVTGASRGLGEAIALELVAPGAAVIGIARGESRALAARATAGAHVEQVACDLARVGELDALLSKLLSRLPLVRCSLVALVNNAGVLEPVGPAGALAAGAIGTHLAVNVAAPLVLTNAFLRETASLGASRRILNVSSGAGRNARAGWSVYCAGKAALDHFTRAVALEQRALANGARVVALAPGVIDTDMQATVRGQTAERFPTVAQFLELHRTGALVAPADAARRVAAFLHAAEFGDREVADLREMAA
jgi:NAD(P)-dependent dehydrogenase (short-subunit alcohol dehydrogenase family)